MRIGLVLATLAAAAVGFATGAALAAPAAATANVNVRSGPGTGYAILDTLATGEVVDIARCTGGWCYVGKPGSDGWVSQSYLERLPPAYAPPPIIVRPQIVIRPPIYHRPPPHRPPVKPRPPGKPRPPICKDQPQLPICRPR